MKVIKAYPPNFVELTKHFPITGKPGILYAWGGTLYNPSGVKVTPWIMAHEEVHSVRQLTNSAMVEDWWHHYIDSAVFRYEEEILAHRAEWRAYKGPDGVKYLMAIATRLASPLYGRLLSYTDAVKAIIDE